MGIEKKSTNEREQDLIKVEKEKTEELKIIKSIIGEIGNHIEELLEVNKLREEIDKLRNIKESLEKNIEERAFDIANRAYSRFFERFYHHFVFKRELNEWSYSGVIKEEYLKRMKNLKHYKDYNDRNYDWEKRNYEKLSDVFHTLCDDWIMELLKEGKSREEIEKELEDYFWYLVFGSWKIPFKDFLKKPEEDKKLLIETFEKAKKEVEIKD